MTELGNEAAAACNEWADLYGDLFQEPCQDSSGSDSDSDRTEPTKGFGSVLLEDEIQELRSKLAAAEQQLREVGGRLEEQETKTSALDKERATLVKNISTLYRTAVLQLSWKADEIKALRSELRLAQLQKPASLAAPMAGAPPQDVGHKRQRVSQDDVAANPEETSLQPLSAQPNGSLAPHSQARGASAAERRGMHEGGAHSKERRRTEDRSRADENMPRSDRISSQEELYGKNKDDGHRQGLSKRGRDEDSVLRNISTEQKSLENMPRGDRLSSQEDRYGKNRGDGHRRERDGEHRQKEAEAGSLRGREGDNVLKSSSSDQNALEKESYRSKHHSAGERAEAARQGSRKENRASYR